jgi:hypothetical protein
LAIEAARRVFQIGSERSGRGGAVVVEFAARFFRNAREVEVTREVALVPPNVFSRPTLCYGIRGSDNREDNDSGALCFFDGGVNVRVFLYARIAPVDLIDTLLDH